MSEETEPSHHVMDRSHILPENAVRGMGYMGANPDFVHEKHNSGAHADAPVRLPVPYGFQSEGRMKAGNAPTHPYTKRLEDGLPNRRVFDPLPHPRGDRP